MKKRIKFRSLSMLLAALVCLTLGLSLIPSFGVATHAAEEQTYKIYVVPTSYPNRARTLVERTTLPYTISGSALSRFIGYSPACDHITEDGDNVTIDGTNISINGEGTANVWVWPNGSQYAPFRIEVTKNITATATGYTGAYDGNAHGISVSVAIPSSGAEVKYGTTSGTYNLTSSPEYTDAGTYTVYYQVTAEGYNTLTGSAQVIINKATPTVTALPTASAISYGQTLADSTLSGGTASVPGTFAWKNPSTAPTVNDSNSTTFPIVFTPNDTTNYNSKNADLTVIVEDVSFNAVDGGSQTYNKSDLIFRFMMDDDDANTYQYMETFKKATIKGPDIDRALNSDEYTVEKGSLKLTLMNSFLETLKPGTYTVTVYFVDETEAHSASANFTVPSSGGTDIPETDPSSGGTDIPETDENIMLIGAAMILVILSLSAIAYIMLRQRRYLTAKN